MSEGNEDFLRIALIAGSPYGRGLVSEKAFVFKETVMRSKQVIFVVVVIIAIAGGILFYNYDRTEEIVYTPSKVETPEKDEPLPLSSESNVASDYEIVEQNVDDTLQDLQEEEIKKLGMEPRILISGETPNERKKTVEEITAERLKGAVQPGIIHGRIMGIERAKLLPNDKPLKIYARASSGRNISVSAIIDGKYNLGQVPPGTHELFLAERIEMPGLVMRITVEEGQMMEKTDFVFGNCDMEVTILDERGDKVTAKDAKLFVGGTDEDKHMFKRQQGITDGKWIVRNLLPDTYIVSVQHKGTGLPPKNCTSIN